MPSAGWTIVIAACMLFTPHGQLDAQDTIRSSRSGVYTTAQASKGEETFVGLCQSCHAADMHTGPAFQGTWGGKPLSELFVYMTERMPKDNPGALAPQEYAQVLAYLLKLNGMPAGDADLPSDSVALRTIRFDTASAQPTKGSRH